MTSNYISLYNEIDGTYDNIIIDNATINSATIGTANINNETVNTSIINNLTIGNVIYFPDGIVALPSIAFANEHNTGFYRVTTNQIGLVTNGVLRALITNSGLVSVFNIQAGAQFLSNSSSVSAPSFSFVGDPSTGLYESAAGEISIASTGIQVIAFSSNGVSSSVNLLIPIGSNTQASLGLGSSNNGIFSPTGTDTGITCSGTQIYEFNAANFAPVVNGIDLGNLTFPWNNFYFTNMNVSGQLKNSVLYLDSSKNLRSIQLTNGQLLIGSNGTIPTATTLTGTTNQINVTNGAGSITLSTPQNINNTATPTFSSLTLSAINSQLVLGTTNTITLTAPSPSANRIYTIPDVLSNPSFVLTNGVQTLAGVTTFSNNIFFTGLVGSGVLFLTSSGQLTDQQLSNGQLLIGRSGNTPVNANITGTTNQVNVTNGSGSITLSTPQNIGTSATPTFAGLTINGNINAGTNSMTCGALSSTSITNTGSFNNGTNTATVGALTTTTINAGTNAATVGALSTTTINSGTNSVTCGSLICSTFNPTSECVFTTAGGTSAWHAGIRLDSNGTTASNYYGYSVIKNGFNALYIGINSNSTVGQIPASAVYLSSYGNTLPGIYIGRGGNNSTISFADIAIDSNGAVSTMNNILVIRTCTSSQSINTTAPTTFTTFDTSIVNQGNTTYSAGVFTFGTAGVYQCSYDILWAASVSGYRQCYINATAGAFASSIITSPGSVVIPQSGSASIQCAIGDTVNLLVYQSTGSALNIAPSGNFQIRFTITKIQ